jgi:hypothetical protein
MAAKNPTGEPDPAPFKIHLMTRAGRVMRARSGLVRAFSTKDEAIRFAGRQLGGHYAVYHKHKKIWPGPPFRNPRMMSGCSVAAISHPFWPSSAASISKSPSQLEPHLEHIDVVIVVSDVKHLVTMLLPSPC